MSDDDDRLITLQIAFDYLLSEKRQKSARLPLLMFHLAGDLSFIYVLERLKQGNPEEQRLAFEILANLVWPHDVETDALLPYVLCFLEQDEHQDSLRHAIRIMTSLIAHDKAAAGYIEKLRENIFHENPEIRLATVIALHELADTQSIPTFISLLDDLEKISAVAQIALADSSSAYAHFALEEWRRRQ